MRAMRLGIWILIFSQASLAVGAQSASEALVDTTRTIFSAADFYQNVLQHHPIVSQAALLTSEAQQEVRQARGMFDPKLFSVYDRKEFGQSLYYDKWQSGILVPFLPGGIDVKLTYDRAMGRYLNPEERVPSAGLASVGLYVPVGQGLLLDARRTTLRQAQLGVNLANADRLKLINKTLYDAAKTYWDWYLSYQQYRFVNEGYQVADIRFRAIRERALLGEAAAIDTTEALITLQERLLQLRQAEVALQNARLHLTSFLWNTSKSGELPQPLDIPSWVIPQSDIADQLDEALLPKLLQWATERHPDVLKLTNKTYQLAIEERFRRSLLQPQIGLNVKLSSYIPEPGTGYNWANNSAFRLSNHSIGVDLSFPLFLRKERGKWRQVQLKSQQVEFERKQTARDIANEIQLAWNSVNMLRSQIAVQQQTVINQRTLLQAEQQKFDMGESALFFVNSRESKLIDLQIKLEELRTKFQQSIAMLWYVAGTHVEAQLP